MNREAYVLPDAVTPEQIKAIRKKLKLTQAGFADFICVSKKTVERWETGKESVSGPIVPLISMLGEYPDFEQKMRVPKKEFSLRLWYMYQNEVCTIIDVEERLRKVKMYNFTNDLIKRAFGRVEEPSFEQYEEFLESRCFPPERDKMKLQLEHLGLPFYDPILIIEKTQGRMAEDFFWIRIER
ncbi:MAG: helix-turn-helix domain-containing protein [Clostridiales bacterium]|nr:helix-turn-helix domain-containing protein [Clostridiales bacterium]